MKKTASKPTILKTHMSDLSQRLRFFTNWHVVFALILAIFISSSVEAQVGLGGTNILLNSGFELGETDWTLYEPNTSISTKVVSTNATYLNSGGACGSDPMAQNVFTHSGTNTAFVQGYANALYTTFSQQSQIASGSTFQAGGWAYVSHEDMITGVNTFYFQVDFLDNTGNVLASYESYVITNLICGQGAADGSFPLDTWNFLAVTNQIQVSAETMAGPGNANNAGVVIGTIPAGSLIAPPGATSVLFTAFFEQPVSDSGSVFFDDCNLGITSGPIPTSISSVSYPSTSITFCTNNSLDFVAAAVGGAITNVQITVKTMALGNSFTNITTYTSGISLNLIVTGLDTTNANINFTLDTNLIYLSEAVTAKNNSGLNGLITQSTPFDTIAPTLVIEGSDFNFNSGQFIDTPLNGGWQLYAGLTANNGIDALCKYYRNPVAYGLLNVYRTNQTATIAAMPSIPPSYIEQKYATAAANGDTNDVPVCIGFTGVGDWQNYTRTFASGGSAAAGKYNVWCFLSSGNVPASSPLASLSLVTSDQTQPNQTTQLLGYFNTPLTGSPSNFGYFYYTPMVDAGGNLVSISLTNIQTLRATISNSVDIAFYVLMPVTSTINPVINNVNPISGSLLTNQLFTFTVITGGGSAISQSGISVNINQSAVPASSLIFTATNGTGWNVSCPLPTNQYIVLAISVTNSTGQMTFGSYQFDTFDITNNYQLEAVDYDFSTNNGSAWISDLFIDNPVPTCDALNGASPGNGTFTTSSYFGYPTGFTPGNDPNGQGAIARQGIDINFTQVLSGSSSIYRADSVGTQAASDLVRPKFIAAQQQFNDPNIGPVNIGFFSGGEWLNYTRTWPANYYTVWARVAAGGSITGCSLNRVTNGVGTINQMIQRLGTISGPSTGGWQTYKWLPVVDTNGNPAVIQLGGKSTLRLSADGNSVNVTCLMLVPAVSAELPLLPFQISATQNGDNINLTIPTLSGHSYTVWQAPSLTPPINWQQIINTNITDNLPQHTMVMPRIGNQSFYRVTAQ